MIVHNILEESKKEQIKSIVTSLNFPWYWRDGLIIFDRTKPYSLSEKYPLSENFMFMNQISKNHEIFDNSLFELIVRPILLAFEEKSGMKVKYVNRSQVNLVPRVSITEEEFEGSLHRDRQPEENVNHDKLITILYYPTTSDGPTVTYDEQMNIIESCDPIENTLLYYKSVTLHRLFVPTLNKRRLSININIEIY